MSLLILLDYLNKFGPQCKNFSIGWNIVINRLRWESSISDSNKFDPQTMYSYVIEISAEVELTRGLWIMSESVRISTPGNFTVVCR